MAKKPKKRPAKKRSPRPSKAVAAAPQPAPPPGQGTRRLLLGLGLGFAFAVGFLAGNRQGWVEVRDGRGSAAKAARKKMLRVEDGQYVDHGPYQGFYKDSGKLMESGEYFMGKKHGLWTEWHPNGQMKRRGRYVDGVEARGWQAWDEQGQELKK